MALVDARLRVQKFRFAGAPPPGTGRCVPPPGTGWDYYGDAPSVYADLLIPRCGVGKVCQRPITSPPLSGGARLKKVRKPLYRTNPSRKAPMESATDFAIGTVRPGKFGVPHIVIKAGRTRRWKRL